MQNAALSALTWQWDDHRFRVNNTRIVGETGFYGSLTAAKLEYPVYSKIARYNF